MGFNTNTPIQELAEDTAKEIHEDLMKIGIKEGQKIRKRDLKYKYGVPYARWHYVLSCLCQKYHYQQSHLFVFPKVLEASESEHP